MYPSPRQSSIAASIEDVYGERLSATRETPFSWLFFSSVTAYKVRKDVAIGVAGQSHRQAQQLTMREFIRGSRFSPGTYQDLETVKAEGRAYLVLAMKRIRDDSLLRNIYQRQGFDSHMYSKLVDGINQLHARSRPVKRRLNMDLKKSLAFLESFKSAPPLLFNHPGRIRSAISKLKTFVDEYSAILEARSRCGFVLDTHGDLHSSNIFIASRAVFIDPAVASPALYQIDYLDQIADILLDLRATGYDRFADDLIHDVSLAYRDEHSLFLLSRLYMPLNAIIRIRVYAMYKARGLQSSLPVSANRYLKYTISGM